MTTRILFCVAVMATLGNIQYLFGSEERLDYRAMYKSEKSGVTFHKGFQGLCPKTSGLAVQDTSPVMIQLNGREVGFYLTGNSKACINFEGHEYPLCIWEAYPGILHIGKYFESVGYGEEDQKKYLIEMPVLDRVEFYNTNQVLLQAFEVDAHNPYLHNQNGIEVLPYFSDAENTWFLPDSLRTGKEKITKHFVRTAIEAQNHYTKIAYWMDKVTNEGWILGTETTLLVLDSLGQIIFQHQTNTLSSLPAVSLNGKYILFANLTLETTVNAGFKTQAEGFEIWETLNKKCIYSESNSDPQMWIASPYLGSKSGFLIIDYTFPFSNEWADKVYLFDPEEVTLYNRVRSRSERAALNRDWFDVYQDDYRNVLKKFDFETIKLSRDGK